MGRDRLCGHSAPLWSAFFPIIVVGISCFEKRSKPLFPYFNKSGCATQVTMRIKKISGVEPPVVSSTLKNMRMQLCLHLSDFDIKSPQ